MTTTKIFAITIDPEELPDFGAQALQMILEAALTDDKPLSISVNEVSISIPLGPIFNNKHSEDKGGIGHLEALPADENAKFIDVATKNAALMASKGTISLSEKLKDAGTHAGEIKAAEELKPTGEASPHNVPGKKNIFCSNPQRIRESLRGTGSIEFCSSCGFQYRDSDLGR